MRWTGALRRLRGLLLHRKMDEELEDELQFHLEMQARKNLGRDLEPSEAKRMARLQFGNLDRVKEECRDQRGFSAIDTVAQDVRYGLHQLRKHPGFTAAALLLLGIGIGATTAVFTATRQLLLRGLAVENPNELTQLEFDDTANNIVGREFSYPAFQIFAQPNQLISGMFARSEAIQVNVTSNGLSDVAQGAFDSPSTASVLGLSPALGRLLNSGDAKFSGESPPVVLSFRYWQKRFGGDPNVIGKMIAGLGYDSILVKIDNWCQFPCELHGDLKTCRIDPDIILPVYTIDLIRGLPTLNNRASWGFTIICRRKPGATQEQIRASLAPRFAAVLEDFPASVPASMAGTMKQFASKLRFRIDSASLGVRSQSRAQMRQTLLVLMGITGLCFL